MPFRYLVIVENNFDTAELSLAQALWHKTSTVSIISCKHLFPFLMIYLFEKQNDRKRRKGREKMRMKMNLPSSSSLPKCEQQSELGQAEAKSLELYSALLYGWQWQEAAQELEQLTLELALQHGMQGTQVVASPTIPKCCSLLPNFIERVLVLKFKLWISKLLMLFYSNVSYTKELFKSFFFSVTHFTQFFIFVNQECNIQIKYA